MYSFAFFCTQKAGWEIDDTRISLYFVAAIVSMVLIYKWLPKKLHKNWLRKLVTIILILGIILSFMTAFLFITYVAPC